MVVVARKLPSHLLLSSSSTYVCSHQAVHSSFLEDRFAKEERTWHWHLRSVGRKLERLPQRLHSGSRASSGLSSGGGGGTPA